MPGYFRMRRDLTAPIDPLPLPKGIELVPFSKALSNESRELMMRVYPDGLNDGGISFEGFWTWLTNEPEYDPALMFVACQNGIVVGFCHCWRDDFVKDLVVALLRAQVPPDKPAEVPPEKGPEPAREPEGVPPSGPPEQSPTPVEAPPPQFPTDVPPPETT